MRKNPASVCIERQNEWRIIIEWNWNVISMLKQYQQEENQVYRNSISFCVALSSMEYD